MLTAVRAALAEGEESFGVPHNAHIKVVSFESPTESAPPSEGDCERKESVPAVAYVAGSGGLLKRNQEVETGLAQERAKQSGNPAGAQSVNHEADRYSREVAAFQLKFDGAEEARMQAADALDESNARLADVEGKLSEYWEELLNDGADLNQIQERHREQDEKIENYEVLLQQTSAEVEELRSELRAKQYVDECLQEYEVENERLVAQLSTANDTIQQLRAAAAIQLDTSASSSRESCAAPDVDAAALAAVLEATKARNSELEIACTHQKAELATMSARYQEALTHARVTQAALDEAHEKRADEVMAAKDEHAAELQQAVESFRLEEAALHDEIDVTKALLEGKELMVSDNEHRFQCELDILREEIRRISDRDESEISTRSGTKEPLGLGSEQPVRLQLEMDQADREVALAPKSEMKVHLDTTFTVIESFAGNLIELDSAYKAVTKAGYDLAIEKSKSGKQSRNPFAKFHQKIISAVETAAAAAAKPRQKADSAKLAAPDTKQEPKPEHVPTRYEQLAKVKDVYECHAAALQDRLQASIARAQESIRQMIGSTEV